MSKILLAILIGGAFGFALDRAGATNPNLIIHMLRLSRLHLAKVILLAIGVAQVLLFSGLLLGIVDPGHIHIKAANWGVILGGILLGVGFAVGGYCPGTSVTAAATGRKDALFFVLGGLIGAFAYMLAYGWVKSTGVLAGIAGGKVTLFPIAGTKYPALFPSIPGEWAGIVIGLLFIGAAFALPECLRCRTGSKAAATPAE